MSNWHDISRGTVFPWQCDHYGHMNVRWYANLFDDASFPCWSCYGIDMRAIQRSGLHTAVVRATLTFHSEMRAGDQYLIRGRFRDIGNTSVILDLRMVDAIDDTPRANDEYVLVTIDSATRKAAPLPALMSDPLLAAGVTRRGTSRPGA